MLLIFGSRPPSVALPEKIFSSLNTAGCAVHDVDQKCRANCNKDNHRDPQRRGTARLRGLNLRMPQRFVRKPHDKSGAQQRKYGHSAAENEKWAAVCILLTHAKGKTVT